MGMRIHTADVRSVVVEYADNDRLVQAYDDEMDGCGPALIIEDTGNMEALVLKGSPEAVRSFAKQLLDAIPGRDLTPDEREFLTYIAESYGWAIDDGDLFYDKDADQYWWDSPDATTFDLTNEIRRSRSIEED